MTDRFENYSLRRNTFTHIHVLDADRHTREVLTSCLKLEGYQTSASASLAEFERHLSGAMLDLVLFNLNVDGESSVDYVVQRRADLAGIPMVGLQDVADVASAIRAVKLCAVDVVVKPFDAEAVLNLVKQNVRVRPQREAEFSLPALRSLTSREREVLRRIVNGYSNKEAGRELQISPRTIEVHRSNIMKKLGARNIADLMRITVAAMISEGSITPKGQPTRDDFRL